MIDGIIWFYYELFTAISSQVSGTKNESTAETASIGCVRISKICLGVKNNPTRDVHYSFGLLVDKDCRLQLFFVYSIKI